MFYWHIITINKDELIYKFFQAQQLAPSEHDWVLQLERDKKEINLQLSESQMKQMTKDQFKRIVKTKIEFLAAKSLEKIKNSHSKTKNLKLTSFTPQKYLLSKNLKISEVQTLYKLRNNMIDVKESFKYSYRNDMWCKMCRLFQETQQHLLDCPKIRLRLKGIVKFESISYNMIFGSIMNQEKFAKSYKLILDAREDIMNEQEK